MRTSAITQTNRAVRFSTPRSCSSEPLVVEARGIDAGPAAERIHFEPRIVGEQISIHMCAVIESFRARVLFERPPGFFRRRQRDRNNFKIRARPAEIRAACRDSTSRSESSHVLELPLHRDQFADPVARQRQQSSQLRVVERRLLRRRLQLDELPEPVITTFISTSACESSW